MSKKYEKISGFDGIMYSTNTNFDFEQPEQPTDLAPNQQNLRVWLETKHRGGKTATVVKDFLGSQTDLEALAKLLKNKCGTGGSVKNGEIIIQGDFRTKIIDILVENDYKAKKAGG